MYLHLGQGVVVPQKSIVGIFDLDNTTQSHITRRYLNLAEAAGNVVNVSEDLPKSFVICQEAEMTTVYLSQLSSATLLKRSESVTFE